MRNDNKLECKEVENLLSVVLSDPVLDLANFNKREVEFTQSWAQSYIQVCTRIGNTLQVKLHHHLSLIFSIQGFPIGKAIATRSV